MSYEELGTQFDGEPTSAVESEVTPVETPVEVVGGTPATETHETEVEKADEVAEDSHKKKSGSQRWKEKAQRESEEKEYWKREALKSAAAPASSPTASTDGRPTSDQFPDVDSYVEALVEWKDSRRKAEEGTRQRVQSWEQKAQEARKEIADFDDVLESAPAPSPTVAEVLTDSPHGAKLAYHLATHEDEYKRINRLSPVNAARELGILEAKLTAPKTEPKKTTKAPPPITPVVASGTPAARPAMRFEEF